MPSTSHPLPPPVRGERFDVPTTHGHVACWAAEPEGADAALPILLVHSVNAAGSAYEMGPLFDHFASSRAVVAMELPGFGHSTMPAMRYSVRQMTDAVAAVAEAVRNRYSASMVDAIGLSLGCEFLARAATEQPAMFGLLGLISPTGFDGTTPRLGPAQAHRGNETIYRLVAGKPWSGVLYGLLTSRPSLRFFLRKTFGADSVSADFVEYDYALSQQPGAMHAPLTFLSGFLFSQDVFALYESLTQPVWLVHGTRGDFVDYRLTARVLERSQWTVQVLDGGALPHFEQLEQVAASWRDFEARHRT